MQIVHLLVTGCIFSKIVFVSKYLHFRLNEKPATGYKFKVFVKVLVSRKNLKNVENSTKKENVDFWSNMKPLVENNLTG